MRRQFSNHLKIFKDFLSNPEINTTKISVKNINGIMFVFYEDEEKQITLKYNIKFEFTANINYHKKPIEVEIGPESVAIYYYREDKDNSYEVVEERLSYSYKQNLKTLIRKFNLRIKQQSIKNSLEK